MKKVLIFAAGLLVFASCSKKQSTNCLTPFEFTPASAVLSSDTDSVVIKVNNHSWWFKSISWNGESIADTLSEKVIDNYKFSTDKFVLERLDSETIKIKTFKNQDSTANTVGLLIQANQCLGYIEVVQEGKK